MKSVTYPLDEYTHLTLLSGPAHNCAHSSVFRGGNWIVVKEEPWLASWRALSPLSSSRGVAVGSRLSPFLLPLAA